MGHRASSSLVRGLLAGLCVAGLALAAAPAALATGGCSDSWTNPNGGQWDTGSNWSTGSAPGSTDNVCITAAGSYTVIVNNESITVASLTLGGSGSTPTLQIGNSGSGEPDITITNALTVNTGSTYSFYGSDGSMSAGSLTNAGTFVVPSEPYTSSITLGNTTNTGSFTNDGATTNLSIDAGDTFDNAGGTITNAAGDTLAISTPSAPTGILELGASGEVTNSGTLSVADAVQVNGGTICGDDPLNIGSADGGTGGSLTFASSQGAAGPTCGTGQATDHIFIYNISATLAGTIPSTYTVAAGDSGSSYFSLALQGDVINDGTFEPGFGGTVSSAASSDYLTNAGTTIVPPSSFTTNLNIPLVNQGSLEIQQSTNAVLPSGGTTWNNESTGTISVSSGMTLQESSSDNSGILAQDGTITNLGTINWPGSIDINGGTLCANPVNLGSADGETGGTLTFPSKVGAAGSCATGQKKGQLFIYNVIATIDGNIPSGYTVGIGNTGSSFAHVSTPGALTNSGTLEPAAGATLTITGNLTNSGTITVPAEGFTTVINADDLTNNGTLTADATLDVNPGTGDTFTNGTKGKLTVADDTLTLAGSLINNGTLTIDPKAELSIADNGSNASNYTQASTGTLVDPISGTGTGVLDVTGTAALAGTVNFTNAKFTAPYGKVYTFIDATGGSSGSFATVTGPYTVQGYGTSTIQAVAHPTATVTLSPTSGTPPVKVTVKGAGYEAGETVKIYLDSTSGTALASPKASSTGTFSTTITIPSGTSPGNHSVIAVGQTSDQSASATFTVDGGTSD